MRSSISICAFVLIAWTLPDASTFADSDLAKKVDFNRDIRPILSENCFNCHGPDTKSLQGGLRLDRRDSVFSPAESGKAAVVSGKAEASELWRRAVSKDEQERMPPPETNKQLTTEQLSKLKQWIDEGAQWTDHWSFQPIVAQAIPQVHSAKETLLSPIDAFIIDRLGREGWQLSPPESRERLIRRASLDLTGLPPSIVEIDAFVNDQTDRAFENVVDRLLDSKHFGERLALIWLDLARYGDTSGYHNDSLRDMWLWREWVINAFNANMPFDQFTIEQIAGDLLPNATIEQQVASGFHRNHMTSDEGGLIDAEYRNLYVVDRVNTTGVAWLGMTVGCAQCHDHKYDPLSMRDYYSMYAFFNNVPENGKDGVRDRNPKPFLRVTTAEQESQLKQYEVELASSESELKKQEAAFQTNREIWEKEVARLDGKLEPVGPVERYALDGNGDGVSFSGEKVKAASIGTPQFAQGAIGQSLVADGTAGLAYERRGNFERDQPISIGLHIKHKETGKANSKSGAILASQASSSANRGWCVAQDDGRPSLRLVHRWPDNCIHIEAKEKLPADQFTHILFTYDGSSIAEGIRLYVNGRLVQTQTKNNSLSGSIAAHSSLTFLTRAPGAEAAGEGAFQGQVDDIRIYPRVLEAFEAGLLGAAGTLRIAATPVDQRTKSETDRLNEFYLQAAAPGLAELRRDVETQRKTKDEYEKSLPNTMVMAEMETPRETFIKVRGNYDQDGQRVSPGVPEFLPALRARPDGKSLNRVDFARWLVSREQPLTARVMVNRLWAMLMGNGIVKTLNDFGSQGERPSHPELLDWLAADFQSDWNIKRMLKQIVLSSTYRQSAAASLDQLARDKENRLLSRGPRQRLDAEAIRDNALAIAGVLNPRIGGKSIKPYQPEGTWEINEMSGYKYVRSTGEDLYRRGLYVYWRRSTVYPSFVTLDAPTREFCVAQRAKTSTPLQSLVLMNDPTFVEAGRAFAQRILAEKKSDNVESQLAYAWRLALARYPSAAEMEILRSVLAKQIAAFQKDRDSAKKLLSVGDLVRPAEIDEGELAAWTAVANVILNLNETITN